MKKTNKKSIMRLLWTVSISKRYLSSKYYPSNPKNTNNNGLPSRYYKDIQILPKPLKIIQLSLHRRRLRPNQSKNNQRSIPEWCEPGQELNRIQTKLTFQQWKVLLTHLIMQVLWFYSSIPTLLQIWWNFIMLHFPEMMKLLPPRWWKPYLLKAYLRKSLLPHLIWRSSLILFSNQQPKKAHNSSPSKPKPSRVLWP